MIQSSLLLVALFLLAIVILFPILAWKQIMNPGKRTPTESELAFLASAEKMILPIGDAHDLTVPFKAAVSTVKPQDDEDEIEKILIFLKTRLPNLQNLNQNFTLRELNSLLETVGLKDQFLAI